jgi:DNA-binding NtrC family response regulator
MNHKHILVVEPGTGTDWQTEPLLDQEVYAVEILRTGDSALSRLQQGPWVDAVLLDLGVADIELPYSPQTFRIAA